MQVIEIQRFLCIQGKKFTIALYNFIYSSIIQKLQQLILKPTTKSPKIPDVKKSKVTFPDDTDDIRSRSAGLA